MPNLKCATAAAVLLLSISGASACDDYADELAMAEAQSAAKLAQSATSPPPPTAQVATPATGQPQPTGLAATEPKPAQPQTTATLAGTVRQ